MLSSANIEHGINLALIMLASIVLLIIAGLLELTKKKNASNQHGIRSTIVSILLLVGLCGLSYTLLSD